MITVVLANTNMKMPSPEYCARSVSLVKSSRRQQLRARFALQASTRVRTMWRLLYAVIVQLDAISPMLPLRKESMMLKQIVCFV